ncbi:MAG: class I SAM-dependent methyltransferase [Burkholderiaceae bacterium]|nr:class I SAM-dependent methyltransferase [Burkholderiaceae bacterium]
MAAIVPQRQEAGQADAPFAAAFAALVKAAADRYRAAGHTPYHFARGKLAGDPVFAALLAQRLIPDGARLVDLGCGQGVLLALLAAAQDEAVRARWPQTLPALPRAVRGHGVDLRPRAVAAAHIALGPAADVQVGDVRDYVLPPCDVVAILDVLHYIDFDAQRALLARVHAALAPGGRLLLRVGDAAAGRRFALTLAADWLITLVRGHWQRRFYCRSVPQWQALLQEVGFSVRAQPMSAGTPFANALLIGDKEGCA